MRVRVRRARPLSGLCGLDPSLLLRGRLRWPTPTREAAYWTTRRPWRHSFALDQRWRWHRRGVPLWRRQRRVRETRAGMDRAPVSPHAPIQRHSAQTRRCAREAARGRRVSGGLRGPGAWSRPRNQPALPLRGQASTLGGPQVAALPASSQRSVGRRRRRTSTTDQALAASQRMVWRGRSLQTPLQKAQAPQPPKACPTGRPGALRTPSRQQVPLASRPPAPQEAILLAWCPRQRWHSLALRTPR